MNEWVKLKVIGPRCRINRAGEVRQERIILKGKELHNYLRVPSIDAKGNPYLAFRAGNRQQNCQVRRLVAETFIPNPRGKRFVICEDGDPLNVDSKNLRWATSTGTRKRSLDRILSARNVRDIRTALQFGMLGVDLAKDYHVSPSMISHIGAGRRR